VLNTLLYRTTFYVGSLKGGGEKWFSGYDAQKRVREAKKGKRYKRKGIELVRDAVFISEKQGKGKNEGGRLTK